VHALNTFVMFSLGWLALAQHAPPECKLVTYWGITGCEASAQDECATGYHKQLACPTNPMIKAPCHWLCVADTPKKDRRAGDDDSSKQRWTLRAYDQRV